VGLAKTRLAGEKLRCAGRANGERSIGMVFASARVNSWLAAQRP
jgi:hypothetical protein